MGDGLFVNRSTPFALSGVLSSGVDAIAINGQNFALALKGGQVYVWGDNSAGNFGNGSVITPNPSLPTLVPGLSNIVAIASTGQSTSYALSSDGSLWVFGLNYGGELGTGSTAPYSNVPIQLLPPSGFRFTQIDGGDVSVLATVAPAPEPTSLALLGLGAVALFTRHRRRMI